MGKFRKLFSKKKPGILQASQDDSVEDLELAGDFTLEYQEKKFWQKVSANISKLATWYFVRNKPPMPNSLLTRMFEYKCSVEDNVEKELLSYSIISISKNSSNKSSSQKQIQQDPNLSKTRESSTPPQEMKIESASKSKIVSKSASIQISGEEENDTTSSSTSTSSSTPSACTSNKVKDTRLLTQRKIELLTGRMKFPWAIENSLTGCEICTCGRAKEKLKYLPFTVDMTNTNNDIVPNQPVKLANEEVCFVWSFEDSDAETEYMTPRMLVKDNRSLSDKAELIKRTVDLLNGRAKFSWMDESSNFDEEKWKENAKKFNNYLEELYI